MKSIFAKIILMVLFTASSYAQNDSIIYLKETDFSLYRMQKVRYESTGESKIEKQLINLDDVSTLMFLKSDSLSLLRHAEAPVYSRLSYINEVSKYKNRLNPVLGIAIGAVGGGLLGGIIGYSVSGNPQISGGGWLFGPPVTIIVPLDPQAKRVGAVIGALIGALGGGIIGAVITNAINYATCDLSSVPDKDKKTKLIKFLRQQ